MHIPSMYQVTEWSEIERFINENGFATLINQGNQYPLASHIPMELVKDEQGKVVLWGHLSCVGDGRRDVKNEKRKIGVIPI